MNWFEINARDLCAFGNRSKYNMHDKCTKLFMCVCVRCSSIWIECTSSTLNHWTDDDFNCLFIYSMLQYKRLTCNFAFALTRTHTQPHRRMRQRQHTNSDAINWLSGWLQTENQLNETVYIIKIKLQPDNADIGPTSAIFVVVVVFSIFILFSAWPLVELASRISLSRSLCLLHPKTNTHTDHDKNRFHRA